MSAHFNNEIITIAAFSFSPTLNMSAVTFWPPARWVMFLSCPSKRQDVFTIIEDPTKKDGDDAVGPSWLAKPRRERKVACYTPVLFYREQEVEKKWSDLMELEKSYYISELNDLTIDVLKKLSEQDQMIQIILKN